jgi:DNA-binding CsgD family transcriptional regulator
VTRGAGAHARIGASGERRSNALRFLDLAVVKLGKDPAAAVAGAHAHAPARAGQGSQPGEMARPKGVFCAAALVLTPVALPQAPPVELVSLFDLTPAEARVARSLAAGETVDDIAAAGGVAHSTVRTHLRSILEKTGCHRQAEVVALLTGISAPRG